MAWIEMHQSLPTHAKTWQAADILDIPPVYLVGHLTCFWLWAVDNAPSGRMRANPKTLARAAQWPGDAPQFADALLEAGWIHLDADDYVIHDWDDYAGKLIEQREKNAERMRAARAGKHATTVPPRAENVQDTCAARSPATEQYSTEPNSTVQNPTQPETYTHNQLQTPTLEQAKPAPVARFDFDGWFEGTFWPAYPRKSGKGKAKDGLRRYVKGDAQAVEVMQGLSLYAVSEDWSKDGGEYIPHGSTWVNERRWQDTPRSSPTPSRASPGSPNGNGPPPARRQSAHEEATARNLAGNHEFVEAMKNGTLESLIDPSDIASRALLARDAARHRRP